MASGLKLSSHKNYFFFPVIFIYLDKTSMFLKFPTNGSRFEYSIYITRLG